ncbi:D-amino acid dehydrogenase [Variovorax sp. OV329]|uniref:D-amino acid dehydrogenase n=1 Tax=Variovorax sp. OV329 TaxID=1882825 RepID=UPI0008EEFDB3|nr:D-amino acid dehydrogenase [Variovorax sp. OV329]SFM21572.1 D-amino-acid dehydrogenase [Variovorax sp. OV329]
MKPKHVCVLGAGIVGLATAWQLHREGYEVSVIERDAPGHGASGGNGAQLSYSYVQPLADPSIWKQLPKLLLSPSSPLKLRPALDPLQWRWGLAFLEACDADTSRETTSQLLALAAQSREAFEEMMLELEPACDFSTTGKLVLYSSAASLESARRQLDLQRELGSSPQRLVTPDECVAIEPALVHYRERMAGAIHTPGECAADCLKLCTELEAALAQRGVAFQLGVEVQGFVESGGRVVAARTSAGPFEADAYVLALGSTSQRLARQLGAYLPVYPLKGYSITVDVEEGRATAPHVSVTDSARKVVFARIGSRLRVAGMAELVGHDASIPAERIETLEAATRELFPHASRFEELHPWTGMRPATPTGRPIIGRHPDAPSNLLFNTGHGALGFTLAFGSAIRVAEALARG